ncbi:hypothetical protein, partial [Streptomyces sp. NPDC006320]|uniref:hypothetical protein n=1 Tax=Streptomyces sp. NPDC006320 TaxID=3156750 RepID=UPI0033AA57D8
MAHLERFDVRDGEGGADLVGDLHPGLVEELGDGGPGGRGQFHHHGVAVAAQDDEDLLLLQRRPCPRAVRVAVEFEGGVERLLHPREERLGVGRPGTFDDGGGDPVRGGVRKTSISRCSRGEAV